MEISTSNSTNGAPTMAKRPPRKNQRQQLRNRRHKRHDNPRLSRFPRPPQITNSQRTAADSRRPWGPWETNLASLLSRPPRVIEENSQEP